MSTLDLTLPMLQLSFEPSSLAVVQIQPDEPIPPVLLEALTQRQDRFWSVTRTKAETSVVLPWEDCERVFADVKVRGKKSESVALQFDASSAAT